jgi:hypothetical protein
MHIRKSKARAGIVGDGSPQGATVKSVKARMTMNDRLWLIFANGNDNQRLAAANIMEQFRDGNVSAVKNRILREILERIESKIATN